VRKLVALLFVFLGVALSAAGSAQAQSSTKLKGFAGEERPASKPARWPFEGVWGENDAACRDEDGVDRVSIEGNRFYWYETRCTARDIETAGPRAWTMRISCEGEGKRYRAQPRISLPAPDRLVMDNSPVGPTKRQTYLRCPRR